MLTPQRIRLRSLITPLGLLVGLLTISACTQELTSLGGENPFSQGADLSENLEVSCTETDTEFFSRAVWPTLSTTCIGCHGEANVSSSNTPALVFPSDSNSAYTAVRHYINEYGMKLANKPSMNGEGHTGGRLLSVDSTQAANLAEMVIRVQEPVASCLDSGGTVARELGYRDVTNINAARTARKAALLLQGRMPTNEELTTASTSDSGLETVLAGYLQGEQFEAWLMNSANDHLLTRKYLTGQTEAQEALSGDTYNYTGLYERTSAGFDAAEAAELACANANGTPSADADQPECVTAQQVREQAGFVYRETQRAIAEEPLQLIRHVVTNDLPYSEILTADYMMMNPFTYEVLDGTTWSGNYDDMDPTDWRPSHIRQYVFRGWLDCQGVMTGECSIQAKTSKAYVPSAGILSSPVFLLRYPSTDTNRNRARARWTYYYFLGVDIERLAVRAMDPEELKNVTNPGAEGSTCYGCHIIMDPVAGAYQSWGNGSQFLVRNGNDSLPQTYIDAEPTDYVAGDHWYRGQLKPGFNGVDMPTVSAYGPNSSHEDGLQWLAQQLVNDARFASGTAKFWFRGLFGRDPLLAPTATGDADYAARLQAYQEEQALIEQWSSNFQATNFDLKSLLVDMMMSPLFRGELTQDADAQRRAALNTLGLGRLLSPEQLNRKLIGVTGFSWRWPWQQESQLLESYYMFYGGIDSDGISKRPDALNSLMYSVTERMANEVACPIVAAEFWPGANKALFTGVDIATDPSTAEGEAAIRSAINNLMWRLWGVSDSVEQDALWHLYKDLYDQRMVWSDAPTYLDANGASVEQDEFCSIYDNDLTDNVDIQVNWDGIEWSNEASIREHLGSYYNPEQTLRPWMGVLIAMLTDIQFITE